MIKNKIQTIAAALLVTIALGAPLSLKAADATATPAASATPKVKKAKPTPPLSVTGKVAAVDKTAKTLTIGEKAYTVTDTTKFSAGTLDDLAVGTKVSVVYTKDGDKLTATSVKIAKAKASATPKAKASPKASATPKAS